jgi:hypothetical protein
LGWLEKLSRIGEKFFNPFCSSSNCKKVSRNEMKLFFKNIWLFSKTKMMQFIFKNIIPEEQES